MQLNPTQVYNYSVIKCNSRKASKLEIPPFACPNVSSGRPCSVKSFIAQLSSAKREKGHYRPGYSA
jgi:hypothetical protein